MVRKIRTLFLCGLFFPLSLLADSLDIKIGQMLLVGMQGHTYNEQLSILPAVQKGVVGGILFFEYNLSPAETRERLTNLTAQLQRQSLEGASHLPLFLAIDQEGGQVNRMKPKYGFPAMPSAKSLGDAPHDSIIINAAQTMAAPLSACGINLNFRTCGRCTQRTLSCIRQPPTLLFRSSRTRNVLRFYFNGHTQLLKHLHRQ